MNTEKKIAQAILDAQKMREESYYYPEGNLNFGEYRLEIEECLIESCKQQGLSENLWALLDLAMHWWNDVRLWAEDILAGKNVLEECEKENAKMKDENVASYAEKGAKNLELECVRKNECPDCKTKGRILEGPHGGMSVNVKCGNCGSEFNVTPLGVERL